MENRKKISIYENYAALGELHDAGKISDEDYEKAGRDFYEKRKAAIAEYNACQGPWPYLWKNIDAVVCGILQRFGLHSLDYYDLKILYEAEGVSEIRIKGRGSNDEEQFQSIIDTLRSEYLDLLRSSEKLVITICCSSIRNTYIEKLHDCLNGKAFLLHEWGPSDEEKGIRLSIVTIKETSQQYKLKEWSRWTLEWYLSEVKHVGQNVAYSFYNQSDLSRVKECELMIIGINPGCGKVFSEWEMKDRALHDPDFLYKGNPCFEGKSEEVIIQELSDGWDLWKKMHRMLNCSGKGELLKHLDRFVLTNMIFFGTAKEKQIPKGIDKRECAEKTLKLINILNPNVIVLLGKECRNLFKSITNCTFRETLSPDNKVFYSYYNNSHVISIYHTAYYKYYTNENKEIIGNILGYALDNPSNSIDKKQFESYLSKSLLVKTKTEKTVKTGDNRFKLFKAKIEPNGADSCSLLYGGKLLNYEFYTKTNKEGKLVKTPDRIAVEMLLEGNNYVIRVGTRRNDPKIIRKMANAFDDRFTPGDTELTGPHWHVHAKLAQDSPDDKIVEEMNDLLMWINAYRNGILSSK